MHPTVPSFLSRDSNELWIFWKEFGRIARYCMFTVFFRKMSCFPSGTSRKLTFDLKLCTENGINENDWLWNFQIFLLFLSWNKNIESANIYELYKRHAFTIPYLMIETTKRSKTFATNYSRWYLSLCKVSTRKSVFVKFLKGNTAFF